MFLEITDERSLAWIATVIYSMACFLDLGALLQKRRYLRSILFTLVAGGWVIQTLALMKRGYILQACPLGNPFEILQFITWSSIGLYLLLFPFYRINLLGFFSSALATILNLFSLLLPGADTPYTGTIFGGNPWVELHAALAIFSYGIFGVLASIATMYLLQQHGLKSKSRHSLFRFLPSIRELDAVGLHLIGIGTLLLTIALGVGSIYWMPNIDSVSLWKLGFTGLLWLGYTVALVLRFQRRLISRRFAWACVGLVLFALMTLWPVDQSRRPERIPETVQAPMAVDVDLPV